METRDCVKPMEDTSTTFIEASTAVDSVGDNYINSLKDESFSIACGESKRCLGNSPISPRANGKHYPNCCGEKMINSVDAPTDLKQIVCSCGYASTDENKLGSHLAHCRKPDVSNKLTVVKVRGVPPHSTSEGDSGMTSSPSFVATIDSCSSPSRDPTPKPHNLVQPNRIHPRRTILVYDELMRMMTQHRNVHLDKSLESEVDVSMKFRCFECKLTVNKFHFERCYVCYICNYTTWCQTSYVMHADTKVGFHVPLLFASSRAQEPLYCECGFSSLHGDRLATHLGICNKSMCYMGPAILPHPVIHKC